MSGIVIGILQTNAVIALIIGSFVTYLVKWLATEQGREFEKYEGWAIAAVKAAEKLIADDTRNAGLRRLDYAAREFTARYEKAVGRKVGEVEASRIDAWLSVVHEVLEEAGTLKKLKPKATEEGGNG